ncbi:hypothetical protein PACTADRAFT_23552, partial [Pachysolen tannophilus NRRL Y-2460]
EEIESELYLNYILILAVVFLQMFIQLNFTGPSIKIDLRNFNKIINKENDCRLISLLSSLGQPAYSLIECPILIVLSIKLLEFLNKSPFSLLDHSGVDFKDTESLLAKSNIEQNLDKENDIFLASVQWWRSRALQVQISLIPEPTSTLTSFATLLLNPSVVSTLTNANPPDLAKKLLIIYYLEIARNGLNTLTEALAIPALAKAKKISGLNLVLTGCKAKRTKFQERAIASLIILANNESFDFNDEELSAENPESFQLENDSVLLEKPIYELVGEEIGELTGQIEFKRIKLDYSNLPMAEENEDTKLLPIAIKESLIPESLKNLDPNNQPRLNDLDMIQLFLRLVALRQTSPSNSSLVEEELMALVGRILYSPDGSVNWSIFSKALWERSILETNRTKTVERGVLQMQSLVEELGVLHVKSRIFSETEDQKASEVISFDMAKPLPSSTRLRYIHQLPLLPRWAMDAKLAEKFMSLGVLKSALEIYERLEMWNEAALCYASVGDEAAALKILQQKLSENPNDARSWSIMGDIQQNPSFWIKSWEIGNYPNAKNSLAKYYYNPPKSSGLQRNLPEAIKHQYDSLTINPLSFQSWYFYGCLGLEAKNFELAAEAFTRCVSIDDESPHAWSNLASSLLQLDKLRPAFNAYQKAVRVGHDKSSKSWRIWENYLIVACKLKEWDQVLLASRELLQLTSASKGEAAIDLPIVEKLVDVLLSTEYDEDNLTFFQKSCIDYLCTQLPSIINSSPRCWRVISRVELWRKKPWLALECHEKAYRASANNPNLEVDEAIWNETVEACSDLVAVYESLGELPGKHNAGDVICKDWKYKAKSTVRSLLSKGKSSWEGTKGWDTLQNLKSQL